MIICLRRFGRDRVQGRDRIVGRELGAFELAVVGGKLFEKDLFLDGFVAHVRRVVRVRVQDQRIQEDLSAPGTETGRARPADPLVSARWFLFFSPARRPRVSSERRPATR